MPINQLIEKSVPANILDAVSAAVGNGNTFALPAVAGQVSWQTIFGTAPSAISILLQGSNDGLTWATLDSSTDTSGEIKTLTTSAIFTRGRIASITGGTTVTLRLVAKPVFFLSSSSPFNQTLNTTSDVQFNQLGLGDLFVDWDTDPIYGNAVNSKFLQGWTVTKTDHNNFIDYLAASIEPDAAGAGIYAGRETLMYLPATNTHKANQVYGGEDFIQSFSDLGATTFIGRHISIENYAGPITGRATALLLNVENDAEGVLISGTRCLYTRGAVNDGATSTITLHEAIKIDAGSNAGTVVDNYGLRIIDQTLGGTISGINRTIDVNGKFKLNADGTALVLDGTIQSAFKSSDGTSGISAGPFTVITGITVKNGIVTALTGS